VEVMSNELMVQDKPLSALAIQAQVNTIQEVMNQVMKPNVHYGVIPGCKEPSLFKPGAEKIMATFRLSADPEVIDISDSDQIRYRVKLRLVSSSGVFVGCGIGECSSNEEKYKWRRAVCKEEFDEAPVDRKREKWSKGFQNKPNYKQQQIRTEPADLANTILKMAKKRALIDAVLTCTAASDCFTQDIEDLPPEYINHEAAPAQEPVAVVGDADIAAIRSELTAANYDEAAFCKAAGIASLNQMALARYAGAITHIQGKKNANN
jgi:hypothetical protein